MNTGTKSQSIVSIVADSTLTPTKGPNLDFLTDQVGARLVNDEAFLGVLVTKMMSDAVLTQLAKAAMAKQSDPFDGVYIADLKPDIVSSGALLDIERVEGIRDVSAEVSFADDLD